jgi:hypothetical protein
VPTEIVYGEDGIRWGFQIKEDEKRHRWFKLGLDPESVQAESKLVRDYPDDKILPPPYGSNPQTMPTDYLRALREHVYAMMSTKLTPTAIKNTNFVFIVTVGEACQLLNGAAVLTDYASRSLHCGKIVRRI